MDAADGAVIPYRTLASQIDQVAATLAARGFVPGQVLALLPFSSGTTGLPKAVMLTHGNLTAAARQLGAGLGLTRRDRFLALAPFAHVMGFIVSLCAPLAAGATVITLPRYDLHAMLAAVQRHRVTVLGVPPPVLAALARDPAVGRHDLSAVELIVSGGAPLGRDLQLEAARRFPGATIGQGYGMTETSAVIPVPDPSRAAAARTRAPAAWPA